MTTLKSICILFVLCFTSPIFAHVDSHNFNQGEIFYLNGRSIEGHFQKIKNSHVFIELSNGKTVSAPLTDFSFENQTNLSQKIAYLKQLNQRQLVEKTRYSGFRINKIWMFSLMTILLFFCLFYQKIHQNRITKYSYIFVSLFVFFVA